jgi:hypothetical protein
VNIYAEDGDFQVDIHDHNLSDEWLMSKRLATATRISPNWRGPWMDRPAPEQRSRFSIKEQINFRRLLIGRALKASTPRTFTVSSCGDYVLVTSGHDVFVYRLSSKTGIVSMVVRLAATRDVLKVSMDTSSGRYSIAVLLDNRTGLLWDLADEPEPDEAGRRIAEQRMDVGIMPDPAPNSSNASGSTSGSLPQRRKGMVGEAEDDVPFVRTDVQNESQSSTASQHGPGSPVAKHLLDQIVWCESPEIEEMNPLDDDILRIQTQPAAAYRNLGTPEDPPRSVAICPQQKCVAFGCRMGIELHWVDALTGGDLSRWFPLNAPSDHLHFLPHRMGSDSIRKLRLISSAQGPSSPALTRSDSLPTRLAVHQSTHDRGRRRSMTRLFFGNLPFPASVMLPTGWTSAEPEEDTERRGVLRTVDCDHFQAIPLSDGSHVLYTDPASGSLCLGSDAPVGAPTKLIRKVLFVPPPATDNDG